MAMLQVAIRSSYNISVCYSVYAIVVKVLVNLSCFQGLGILLDTDVNYIYNYRVKIICPFASMTFKNILEKPQS